MGNIYMKIVLGHPSFRKICIVALDNAWASIATIDGYVQLAKNKACEKLGLDEKEIFVLDWDYLGDDVTFIR